MTSGCTELSGRILCRLVSCNGGLLVVGGPTIAFNFTAFFSDRTTLFNLMPSLRDILSLHLFYFDVLLIGRHHMTQRPRRSGMSIIH